MLYLPGDGVLHRLHPLTKLAGALLVAVAVTLYPRPPLLLGVMALLLTMALAAGIARRLLVIALGLLLPLIISLFVIQGVLFPPPGAVSFATFGPIRLTYEGLFFAALIAGRLIAIALAILLVLLSTHPADLVAALTGAGLPHSVGYVVLVALQIAPDMAARVGAILDAQQSRGLAVGRGIARLRALPALVGPLLVGALGDVEERAMAIEARAFLASGPKTSLRVLHDSAVQRGLRWLMLALVLALIVLRVVGMRGVL